MLVVLAIMSAVVGFQSIAESPRPTTFEDVKELFFILVAFTWGVTIIYWYRKDNKKNDSEAAAKSQLFEWKALGDFTQEFPTARFQDYGWARHGKQLKRILEATDEAPSQFQRKEPFYYYQDKKGRTSRIAASKVEISGMSAEKYFESPEIKRFWREEALTRKAN